MRKAARQQRMIFKNRSPDDPITRSPDSSQSIQHGCCYQFFFDMAFDTLGQEPAQVGGALARPRGADERFNWSAKHAGGEAAGFGRDLGAGQPLVTGKQQTVGHGMEVGAAAVEGLANY